MDSLVVVNGIVQSVHEYMISGGCIIFHRAPQAGSFIFVMSYDTKFEYEADGNTFVFPIPTNDKANFRQFMEEVYDNRYNPSVKDVLDKLKVVMELTR